MNGATQLLFVYDTVGKHLDEGKQTDMIFFDFSKAFDLITTCLSINYFGLPIT